MRSAEARAFPVRERRRSANLAGCLSECNPKPHYDERPASPTAGARSCAPCQSAFQGCDEIESNKSAFQ